MSSRIRIKDLVPSKLVIGNVIKSKMGTLIPILYNAADNTVDDCSDTFQDLEFQTPRLIVDSLLEKNDKHYILLRPKATGACKTFIDKILDLEIEFINRATQNKLWFNNENLSEDLIKDNFSDGCISENTAVDKTKIIIKVPFRYNRPEVKLVNSGNQLIPYSSIKPNDEVICVIHTKGLWIKTNDKFGYVFSVKELLKI